MLLKSIAPVLAFGSASLVFAQNSGPHPITGAEARNGSFPIRRNIDDVVKEQGPHFDLYIQALSRMQEANPSDYNSFFQIGGIHHWPHIPWDNAKGPANRATQSIGYCPHGEPLFLSWHRPYVALFEQTLVGHAKEIAAEYPEGDRNKYQEAAETLRTPYWDWALTKAVPEISVPDSVTVNTAKGKKDVRNPLFSFNYPSEALNGNFGDMSTLNRREGDQSRTIRCPAPQSYPQSANNLLRVMNIQGKSTNDLKKMVYDIFTIPTTLDQFASTQGRGMSLEEIHNQIHIRGACEADLLNIYVSGLEPLFMLHHANIDRLWAYWQAIHPDQSWKFDTYPGRPRFTSPAGAPISINSPLEPFYQQNGQPHTPETVASIYKFGYSYEALENGQSDKSTSSKAKSLINELYSGKRSSKRPSPPSKTGKSDSMTKTGSPGPSHSPPRPGEDSRPGRNGTSPSTISIGNTSTTGPKSRHTESGSPGPGNVPDGLQPPASPGDGDSPSPTPSKGEEGGPDATGSPTPDHDNPEDPTHTPAPGGEESPDSFPEESDEDDEDIDDSERHYAQIELDVEQLDRPCLVHVYVGNNHAGSMVVMGEPSVGKVHGAVLLNSAIEKFKSQPKNGSSGEFYQNIHVDIAKPNGTRIDLNMAATLNIEIDQVNVTPPTSQDKLPTVKIDDPKPANDGGRLTLPPAAAKSKLGPRLDDVVSENGYDQGSGGTGDGGTKPKDGPSSAATSISLHMLLAMIPFAVSAAAFVL